MRGKGNSKMPLLVWTRITPAYAGKSSFASCSFASFRDHPRLCGEKACGKCHRVTMTGSPPPMRGKDEWLDGFSTFSRITPAYAGKRLIMYIMCGRIRDHPRLCGEKHATSISLCHHQGSPPPMRGKDSQLRGSMPVNGITPAYAGKSRLVQCWNMFDQDHPRLCGEKSAMLRRLYPAPGSPPPMRGKDFPCSSHDA